MENSSKSATYHSTTIQNELIDICGETILKKVVSEIKDATYFFILAYEATDISNIEQIPIVIRFVDDSSVIRETFLGFSECNEGMSGEAISKEILETVADFGLDMNCCRGQGYDGAGNMAGKCSGAAARIQAVSQKLLIFTVGCMLLICALHLHSVFKWFAI